MSMSWNSYSVLWYPSRNFFFTFVPSASHYKKCKGKTLDMIYQICIQYYWNLVVCNSGLERGNHINMGSYFESEEIKTLQLRADATWAKHSIKYCIVPYKAMSLHGSWVCVWLHTHLINTSSSNCFQTDIIRRKTFWIYLASLYF